MTQEEMINEMSKLIGEDWYMTPSGKAFFIKMLQDFQKWKEFEAEYHLNRHGGYQLLRILLDRALGVKETKEEKKVNDEFINGYVIRVK